MIKNNTQKYKRLYSSAEKQTDNKKNNKSDQFVQLKKQQQKLCHSRQRKKKLQVIQIKIDNIIKNKTHFKNHHQIMKNSSIFQKEYEKHHLNLKLNNSHKKSCNSMKKLQNMLDTKQSFSQNYMNTYQNIKTFSQYNSYKRKNVSKSIINKPISIYQSFKKQTKQIKINIKDNNNSKEKAQQLFFKSLKQNDLFFCPYCYRYVFYLEYSRHYPVCKTKISIKNLSSDQKWKIGWQKIELIHTLSKYIKIKEMQIESLLKQFKNHQLNNFKQKNSIFKKMQIFKQFEKCFFLDIKDIQIAAVIIFQSFIQSINDRKLIQKSWNFVQC